MKNKLTFKQKCGVMGVLGAGFIFLMLVVSMAVFFVKMMIIFLS